MITPITIEYLNPPSRIGGRSTVSQSIPTTCFWSEDITESDYKMAGSRIADQGIDAIATILFDINLSLITPVNVRVNKDSQYYKILKVGKPTLGLGLDGTYFLILKEQRDQGLST